MIEGDWPVPQILVIIEWPSKESAEMFYESVEYWPYRQRRMKGARNELSLVGGEDMTHTARMSLTNPKATTNP